jgi:hypothetical protein
MQENSRISLISSDKKRLYIDQKSCEKSKLLHGILIDYEKKEDLPIPEVDAETLKYVIEYLEHYKNSEPIPIEKPLKNNDIKQVLEKQPWDYEFISKISEECLLKLINAANYMDIYPLLSLSCCRVACKLQDKPINEIQKILGIECDMTEEQKKEYDQYIID